ncbi:MAG: tetratricopeptide repeat protein [Agathobacter sp.]|nr:tetratricopeptide repeat protein [Agathobacter sp.]
MFPLLTVIFIIFLICLKYFSRKGNIRQEEVMKSFWDKERKANSTVIKDIGNLDYITIPSELFPSDICTKSQQKLLELSHEKILNLTGLSNTDIKLKYGVTNFEHVTKCDDNFTQMVTIIPTYANELIECGKTDVAIRLLEFAIDNHADSKKIYMLLAQLYIDSGNKDKINYLIDNANELNSLSKEPIISSLVALTS